MITLFVALYSLLCLFTAVKTSDIKELHVKTVKRGENVTMECNFNIKNKDNLVWYRQSFGKLPQFLARPYRNTLGYKFDEGFKDSRFSITVNDHKFDLNINEAIDDDDDSEGSALEFTSGTRLQFEGKEMKPHPTLGTVNKNTDSVTLQGSDSSDGKGYSCTDQMHVLFSLSIVRVLAFMIIVFPIILLVFKLRSNYKFKYKWNKC
ncbi:uncharacterized protein LOC113525605 [Pangasianodon hypophthalmus]|uniref:uncharacterized protein LOC113525605 n=1 Tax=Pangasianodon hypophthalmus TaxID=310915 RepID=UPI002306DECB|nr:uncharacterized protein LOC113525605 [Pangasianodon hypophthalmus]